MWHLITLQVPSHLLHLHWNHGGSTDGTDSNKRLTNGDCSNGILSFLALSPVFSFHLSIKVRFMDLDRTNRIFYKKVIMDEKRKERYHELDSLIHSDSFFRTYWSLEHWQTQYDMGLDSYACGNYPTPFVGVFSDSFEETFIFFIQYFPNTIFATSFSDNQFKVRKLFKVSLYLA